VLLQRALDRLALVVLATLVALLLAWLVFHPQIVAVLQAALVAGVAAWRLSMRRRPGIASAARSRSAART